MNEQVRALHAKFVEGITMASLGSATILIDWMKAGTVLLGFLGAILACLGGWDAWRSKRTERRIMELELERLMGKDAADESDRR